MRKKSLLLLLCCVHFGLYVFLLFVGPNPYGHLKVALDELQAATFSPADPAMQKSLDQMKDHLSFAKSGFEFQTNLYMGTLLLTVVSCAIVLFCNRSGAKQIVEQKEAKPAER